MSSATRSDGPDASAPGASEEAGGPGRTVERAWLTVMMRELAVKVRNRSVLISTAVTLVLIVGGLGASSLLSGTDSGSEHEIAAVGAGSVEMVEAVDDGLPDDDSASPREATRQEAEQLLDDGKAYYCWCSSERLAETPRLEEALEALAAFTARAIATQQRRSIGDVISDLARRSLDRPLSQGERNGIPLLSPRPGSPPP